MLADRSKSAAAAAAAAWLLEDGERMIISGDMLPHAGVTCDLWSLML